MGGIADYTGSLVCEMTLDRAVAVALQERDDRDLQIFSFNLFDEHVPFTFRISLDALASTSTQSLWRDFNAPGRKWAAYVAGCLYMLHHRKLLDLNNPNIIGLDLALYSTIPMGAGISSSAALEVATMLNLLAHFNLDVDPLEIARLCQEVENYIVGAPCGIMDQMTSLLGEKDKIFCLLLPQLPIPTGIRFVGIDSGVRHSLSAPSQYNLTRTAAFMGHKIILQEMNRIATLTQTTLTRDPMYGFLAKLDPDDYKNLFRPHLPPQIVGQEFLDRFGPTIDRVAPVRPTETYHVLGATDHHVLEARRVRRFRDFLLTAGVESDLAKRQSLLHKSGHLMYASHHSYTHDALLGHPHCDLLVQLIRDNEKSGLYGARITAAGQGGTMAILADTSDSSTEALHQIMQTYKAQTGLTPTLFTDSSPGAIHTGTALL
jgi:L-arabinokinase